MSVKQSAFFFQFKRKLVSYYDITLDGDIEQDDNIQLWGYLYSL